MHKESALGDKHSEYMSSITNKFCFKYQHCVCSQLNSHRTRCGTGEETGK